ncbi:unnamed protein product [Rotaria sordida]|uniref:Uncharacterized protein n=1 Tax=Rotaria sordida TaxID=392033 RepID=A0A816E5Q5_9BILA|nr:unnamed protein product [Rotaria sordida]CAF1645598.1 unnamed protein product [Rotaria sordida]
MSNLTLFNNNIFLLIASINLIPIIIISFLIPITILRRYESLLTTFLSFASGGLTADVFLRLFPYIILSYNDSIDTQSQPPVYSDHDNRAGLFILVGIFLSLIIEKFFRYFQNDNEQTYTTPSIMNSTNILTYLFLLADILHNYTNSLTLCSIILMKSTIDSTTIITKVIYEVLHIFYGYAILIYGGWTLAKAMQFQLLTGLGGSIICLVSSQFQSNLILQLWSNQIFLPIIAGIFIYISTVHIIPEVIGNNYGIKETILKVNAFIISVLSIFYLQKYE